MPKKRVSGGLFDDDGTIRVFDGQPVAPPPVEEIAAIEASDPEIAIEVDTTPPPPLDELLDDADAYRADEDEKPQETALAPSDVVEVIDTSIVWIGGEEGRTPEADLQPALFASEPSWTEQWRGMPEFAQRDLSPFQTVYVHFRNEADRSAFAKLVGQPISGQTRSIWYPKAEIGRLVDKLFVDRDSIKKADA